MLKNFYKMLNDEDLNYKVILTRPIEETDLSNLYKNAKAFIKFGYDEEDPDRGNLESISLGIR